jgi:hypothetical protein
MKPALQLTLCAAAVTLCLFAGRGAWAGGSDSGPEDVHDDGPSYFGFVRDTNGKTIPDAKVTADIKGMGSVITRTDRLGTYKLPGFGQHISPSIVTISCSKEGFRQVRTFNRTPAGKTPPTAIQIECQMQRVGK